MLNNQENLEYLFKLSNVVSKKISPINSVNTINKLLKTYLNINKAEVIIWDNNSMLLKSFGEDLNYDDKTSEKEINFIYSSLSVFNGSKFYFNENEFDCDLKDEEQYQITELKSDNNTIIFPLVANNEVFGLIKMDSEKTTYTKDFFFLLNITSKLISGAIINYILNDQMEVSLNFYKAMKDIAKIIESQYDLSYIIPMIGEMIDRFISSHLIYIFIYQNEEYKLVWPNACKDESVYKLLRKINLKTEYILSDDSKIGIFPLISEETILGAITAYSNIEKLLQKDIDYLVQLTRQSGLTIQRANVYAEVLKYATLDALTGLNNRRQFEIRVKQEVANSIRNNTPLCGLMMDIDYFKKVNDTYGHAAGDCVLKQVSDIIRNELREYDIACRYGGEEFFIILPHTKPAEAAAVAQRLRKVIEESKINIKEAGVSGVNYIKITASIGVCEYDFELNANSFVQKADKALYEAKTTGRNRVIVF